MDWARPSRSSERLDVRLNSQRPPGGLLAVGRHAGGVRPPHRARKQTHLLDRLRCPDVVQLGRPVRRADDEWNPCVVRLDHGGVELGGCRATRHADHRRSARRHGQTERIERRTPLVELDVHPETPARASARGVDREPGQMTASVTPIRAHSSTRVAVKVACTLIRRATPCRGARCGPTSGGAARLHADGSAVRPVRHQLAESHTLVAIDLPGHAGSDAVRATFRRPLPSWRSRSGRRSATKPAISSAYSLGARVALHVLCTHRPAREPSCAHGRHGRNRGRGALGSGDVSADNGLAAELETSGDVEPLPRKWVAGPMFDRLAAADAADLTERRRNSATGLASSLRLCGAGTQDPLWDRLEGLPCPVLALAGADDTRFACARAADGRPRAARASHRSIPGGGHAVAPRPAGPGGADRRHWLAAVAARPHRSNPTRRGAAPATI